MKKILDTICDKVQGPLSRLAVKISSIKFIQAMAETFQVLIPLLILGSFSCLFYYLPVAPWQNFLASVPILVTAASKIDMLSLFIFGLFVLILLPNRYAEKLGMKDTLSVTPVTVLTYLVLTPVDMWMDIPVTWIGQQGIFSVMIISLLVVRIMKWMKDKNFGIRMPSSVPQFVSNGFNAIIPAAIIVPLAALLGAFMEMTTFGSVHNIIFTLIQGPVSSVGISWLGQIVSNVLCSIFFFFGIQPGAITSIFEPMLTAAGLENLAAWTAGLPIPHLFVGGYTNLVSTGSLLYAVVAILIFAKSERYKKVAKFSLIPSFFGISEPMIFGVPIMLNTYLLIPFLLTPILNGILSALVVSMGLIGPYTGVTVSFIMPFFFNQIVTSTTPIAAAVWQVIQLEIDVLLWAPFIIIMDREEQNRIQNLKLHDENQ